jgi:hypothetical protein
MVMCDVYEIQMNSITTAMKQQDVWNGMEYKWRRRSSIKIEGKYCQSSKWAIKSMTNKRPAKALILSLLQSLMTLIENFMNFYCHDFD